MAQLHNGGYHCLRRIGKNGKLVALYVSNKDDVVKTYKVTVYKRLFDMLHPVDYELVFTCFQDALFKFNEIVRHL